MIETNSNGEHLLKILEKLDLHKVVDAYSCLGRNMHIHVRGVIPSMYEVNSVDPKKWESFKHKLEKEYPWNPDHRIILDSEGISGKRRCFYCLVLEGGVTVHKKENFDVELNYDSRSDMTLFEKLKQELTAITQTEKKPKIGIIQTAGHGLHVAFNEYRLHERDLTGFMSKATQEFHKSLLENLNREHDSGLYLIYGQPGTGKTSFIKRILSGINKQALYITPAFVGNLTSPELISLLMKYPDSILVIEDAESALMERKSDQSNTVSNLLNLSDGILADFLNMNIICTFNTRLDNIDPALLRKGRLKGLHEFKELSIKHTRELAEFLEVNIEPDKPMTIAEICNPGLNVEYTNGSEIGFTNGEF